MPEDLEQAIERMLEENLRQRAEETARELGAQIRSACSEAVSRASESAKAEAGSSARSDFAQSLAESARSIRAEDSVTGIASALVDGASKFCGRSLLFIHRGEQLLGFRAAGRVGPEHQEGFEKLSIGVDRASAIGQAISTLSATVSGGGESELSPEVTQLLGLTAEDQVHLFPVALRDKVLAVLACDGGAAGDEAEPTPVIAAAIETLVALAEAWIEAVGTRRKQSSAA